MRKLAEFIAESRKNYQEFLVLREDCDHYDHTTYPKCTMNNDHCQLELCPLEVRGVELIHITIYCPSLTKEVKVDAGRVGYTSGGVINVGCPCAEHHEIKLEDY